MSLVCNISNVSANFFDVSVPLRVNLPVQIVSISVDLLLVGLEVFLGITVVVVVVGDLVVVAKMKKEKKEEEEKEREEEEEGEEEEKRIYS